MEIVLLILQVVLGLLFLVAGLGKLANVPQIRDMFSALGYPRWFRVVTGVVEVIGAVALFASIAIPLLAFFAAVWLALIMVGAFLSLVLRVQGRGWFAPVIVLFLLVGVAFLQPMGLLIALIPPQAATTYSPVPSEIVASHEYGSFLESVQVDSTGNIYYTNISGIAPVESIGVVDMSSADGFIHQITPDGESRVWASLPKGTLPNVIALTDDAMFVTVSSTVTPEHHGVWRFSLDGQGESLVTLPQDVYPNGITVGPDGKLYIADSALGRIWQVDPANQKAELWLDDDVLKPRRFVAIGPAANGLEFWNNDLYVAVTDKSHIVRIPLNDDGTPGTPNIHVTGIVGDDFAIDQDGALYVTTHPFNTVVRVSQTGELTIIAGEEEGVVGSTDAAFSILPGQEQILYVATDGGLSEGRSDGTAHIVRLDVGEGSQAEAIETN
ncbi:MAG: DoxX family protein [Chloroflexota bacterium]